MLSIAYALARFGGPIRFFILSLLFCAACEEGPSHPRPVGWCDSVEPEFSVCADPLGRDLDAIVEEDVMRVALPSETQSLMLAGSDIGGFDFTVLRGFARSRGLQLRVKVVDSLEERLDGLVSGRFDVVAGSIDGSVVATRPELSGVVLHKGQRVVLSPVHGESPDSVPEHLAFLEGFGHQQAVYGSGVSGFLSLDRELSVLDAAREAAALGAGLVVRSDRLPRRLRREIVARLPDVEDHLVVRSSSCLLYTSDAADE